MACNNYKHKQSTADILYTCYYNEIMAYDINNTK